ncbi:MAG: photosynthetic complex assembly protein [Gemmatimonadaceae bacterium]|nr:photosynthetic complex assembly protein [Gemmatimonadaceae bacterium]
MTGPIHFEPEPGARPGAPGMQVPRPALIMAGMLIVFVIGLAASAKWFGFGADREVATTVLMQRELQFADAADGGIVVTDAVTKQQAAVIDPGTNGFLRGALRALTRTRASSGIGRDIPFKLIRYTDGRLVLLDPATSQHVTITSFGHTQVESFDRLLQ